MEHQEFDELGEKIQSIIDNAVDEKNYQKLSETITRTVNKAVENGSDALKDALNNTINNTFGSGSSGKAKSGAYTNYRTGGSQMDYRKGREKEASFTQKGTSVNKTEKKPELPALYGATGGEKTKGVLMTVFGGITIGIFGVGFLLSILGVGLMGLGSAAGNVFVTGAVLLGGITAAGGVLLGKGCKQLTRLSRLKKYKLTLGEHTYCNFKQLAQSVGKSVKFVKKDIKQMIQKGWFLEGHVDQQETCLITSDETYRQYVITQKELEDRQQQEKKRLQEEERREKEKEQQAQTSPQVRQVLEKGNEFLEKIHRSNEAIPGEEISRKISRMELIVQRIFLRAEQHPEVIPDLNRLMDYYLPMTVKLLDAYEEMDSQPVQGENITSSKKEIEETIDTLNTAFEKILDSIFEDAAMDLSSDISVLNTVLAQEGLTEDELVKMRKEAENRG